MERVYLNMKTINLSKTVYQLCKDNPEIIPILEKAGFDDITKPGMLNTAGRFMTIPKGAAMKKISLDYIEKLLQESGYEISI